MHAGVCVRVFKDKKMTAKGSKSGIPQTCMCLKYHLSIGLSYVTLHDTLLYISISIQCTQIKCIQRIQSHYIQSITLTDIHLFYTSHIHTEPPTVMFLGLETPLVDSIPHKPKN